MGAYVQAAARRVRRPDIDARERRCRPRAAGSCAAGARAAQIQSWRGPHRRGTRPDDRRAPARRGFDLEPHIQETVRRIVVRVLFGPELDAGADEVGERLAHASRIHQTIPMLRQFPHSLAVGARQRARESRRARSTRRLDTEIARRTPPRASTSGPTCSTPSSRPTTSAAGAQGPGGLPHRRRGTTPRPRPRVGSCSALFPSPPCGRDFADEADAAAADDARPWADAVVHESCGSTRPGPRAATRRRVFDLGPYRVCRRRLIAGSPLLAGRDPKSWPDPMRFDPTRHLDRAEPEYAWVPFGAGSRSCLGFGLARINLTLSRHGRATRGPRDRGRDGPEPEGMVTSHPEGGVPVTVTSRR